MTSALKQPSLFEPQLVLPGVVETVVVREDSLPERSPRSVSAMRTASALRRKTV